LPAISIKTCAPPWPPSTTIPNRSGRRYRRQDEIGTPYCVTVDFPVARRQPRHRPRPRLDGQIRIPIAELKKSLLAKMDGEDFLTLPPAAKSSRPKAKNSLATAIRKKMECDLNKLMLMFARMKADGWDTSVP